jgi:oxygen-independent coproporphyrinogen-3 oxidase
MRTFDSGLQLMLRHLSEQFFPLGTDLKIDFALFPDRARVYLGDTTKEFAYPKEDHFSPAQAEKLALARAFALATTALPGVDIPRYGILTGVRPTKVALRYLDSFKTEKAASMMLERDYLVSPIQSKILTYLSTKDKLVEATLKKNDILLYISIPFCPSRCAYCSFISSSSPKHLDSIGDYLDALNKELCLLSSIVKQNRLNIRAVYIGGGTPGVLDPHQLERLLKTLRENFDLEKSEFTCEIGRPDTVTKEKLEVLKSFKVGRISINPQTTNDSVLSAIGRTHSALDFFKAYELARSFDFESINCDLIAGLPSESEESFRRSVDDIIALSPENLTVHSFCLKKSAKLSDYKFQDPLSAQRMVDHARESCITSGYLPYYLYRQKAMAGAGENIGFCKAGTEGLYNARIMDEHQSILALGAGGISKVYFPEENRLERVPNVSNYEIYMERIDEMLHRKQDKFFEEVKKC